MRVKTKSIAAVLLMMTALAAAFPQGWHASASRHPSEALKAFVRNYFNDSSPDAGTKIKVATVTTANGKAEDILYISGGGWCGTGGCRLLILEPAGPTFKVLGSVSIVKLPIRVLNSSSNGRPDIGVTARDYDVTDYEAVLSFDGEKYPSNPTVPPARKATAVQGKVIMADTEDSVPLYE